MAFNEKKYRKIQDYLDNDMNEEDVKAFEQELEGDEGLRGEVSLHKDMEELLSDSPENALRKNLDMLSGQVKEDRPNSSRWYLLAIIPVALAIGWWLWQGSPETTTNQITPPPTERETDREPAVDQETTPGPSSEEVDDTPASEEKFTPPPAAPTPGRRNRKTPEAPRAIAANFTPNPSLEFLIENNLRDNEVKIELEKKQVNVQLESADEATAFNILVQLQTEGDLSQQDFKLHLFSNDQQAFEEFSPLSTTDLLVKSIEENSYAIEVDQSFLLTPGLYYYLLEDFAEEKIYLVEKFEVR